MDGLTESPKILMWGRDTADLRSTIEKEYEALLVETLLQEARAQGLEDEVAAALAGLRPEVVRRVVLAPRVVQRLLWPMTWERAETLPFVQRALTAERIVLELEPRNGFIGWTADCRAHIGQERTTHQPFIAQELPVDQVSPVARSIDLAGGSQAILPPRPVPSEDVQRRGSTRLNEVFDAICQVEPVAGDCVLEWTRVVVSQPDESGRFSSGSNGQYVGRTVLVNVGNPAVPTEAIADGLIHEAIHGFLYMHESVSPWVTSRDLYTDEVAIDSPWSGTRLPVRPYMQACFVWYGLCMFWAGTQNASPFSDREACSMFRRAVSGFTRGSLVDRLRPWKSEIDSGVLGVIDELQNVILSLVP